MSASFASVVVIVFFANVSDAPPATVNAARAEVVQLFREAGVEIEWRAADDEGVHGPTVARLTIVPEAASDRMRQNDVPVLGAAMRTPSGSGVSWVFYNRVVEEAVRHGVPPAPVLARVMAHEIGHLLQAREQHALAGLMSACWSRDDFRRAALGELRFTAEDATSFRESAVPSTVYRR